MKIVSQITEGLPILASSEMLRQSDGYIIHGYVVEGTLCLPFVLVKKKRIFRIIQLPVSLIGDSSRVDTKVFLNKAVELLKKEYKPDMIMTMNTSPMSSYPDGAEYCKFGSYILNLQQTEEELFNNIHSKHRNVIRKAEKDGIVIDYGERYKDDCINLIEGTYERQGKHSQSFSHYYNLSKLGEHCDWWVALFEGKIQSCAILLWDDKTSYYLHGGSVPAPHTGATNYLHWEAIKKMKERGVLNYDFVGARVNPEEGSKYEGIQRFKARFGGELVIGYRWEYYCKKYKRYLYKGLLWFKARIIEHSKEPVGVINQERKRGNY